MIKIGIIGRPNVGKSTLFKILTMQLPFNKKNIYESMMSVISILDSTIYNDILGSISGEIKYIDEKIVFIKKYKMIIFDKNCQIL